MVVILGLLVTLVFGLFAKDVERDHSAEGMLPADEPIRDYYLEFKKHFNIRDRIAIALHHEGGVITPAVLDQVKRVSDRLEAGGFMDEVLSLATVENITAEAGQIFTGPLMKEVPRTPEEAEAVRRALAENDLISRALVSRDGKATLIVAQPVFDLWETSRCVEAYTALQEIFAQDPGPATFHLAGYPMIIALADRSMDRDNRVMLPVLLAVVVLLLWFSFRSLRGVWIPLAVVAAATVWTFGTMSLLGLKITVISSSIPIVLVAIGIADGIHIIHEYYHRLRLGKGNADAVLETMREMNQPVVMTSLTTAAGFLALATSSIVPIREYGAAVAFGVLSAMVFSLLFIPACLTLLGKPKRIGPAEEEEARFLHRASRAIGTFSLGHAGKVIVGFLVILAVTGGLSSRIRALQNPIDLFLRGSEIQVSDDFINRHFPGTGSLHVQVDSGETDGIKNPDLLNKIRSLQDRLEAMDVVGNTLSVTDYLARMNRVMHDDDPAFDRIPGTGKEARGPAAGPDQGRAMVSQYLLLYDMAGGAEMENALDDDARRANIAVNVKSNASDVYERVMQVLECAAVEIFGSREPIRTTGSGIIVLKVVQYLVLGQVYSLLVSFGVVFLMLLLVFRSLVYALIGVIPLLVTITSNFAFMVLTGIPLNLGTALIASVCIGIGVDYSIHFITRYRIEAARNPDLASAVGVTLATSGRAIFLNAAAVGGGFAVMLFSRFMPLIYLGFLIPLIMAVNALAALLVIPAFLNVRMRAKSASQP